MKILFAAAEVAPFSKAGGLSDVVGSLPKALEKDAEIAIFTPLHGCIAKIPDVKSNPSFLPYIQSTQYVEKGGRTTFHLLYGKTNDL